MNMEGFASAMGNPHKMFLYKNVYNWLSAGP